MPGGKTMKFATLAGVSLPLALVDPTGVAAGTFVVSVIGATSGAAYHGSRKIATMLGKREDEDEDTASDDELDPAELEEIVRKLASSMTGICISGGLSLVLPHLLVGTGLNAIEFARKLHKLQKMAESQGVTCRDLLRNISKLDIATQILIGVVFKAAFTTLFLGADFDIWVNGISEILQSHGVPSGAGILTSLHELALDHDHLISHEPFATATAIANAPGDAMAQALTGSATPPVWGDGTGGRVTFVIGSVTAATDFIFARLSEEPVNHAMTSASRQRWRWRRRKKNEPVDEAESSPSRHRWERRKQKEQPVDEALSSASRRR